MSAYHTSPRNSALESLTGVEDLRFAVVSIHSGRAISVHQHPDAARRFIDSSPATAEDFTILDLSDVDPSLRMNQRGRR